MVESAFNPTALSVSRASGIWQFIPSTGTHFGLKQNWWFDSRRDVLAATSSALDYLQKLHDEFDDWQLALAAYNWGEGNVARAIARNQAKGLPTDLASLTKVPAETQNYYPKLQAVKNIVADPLRYNLSLGDLPDAPFFAVVHTSKRMDVKLAAELAELPQDDFLALNPQHNRPVIAGADEYTILLPIDNAELFAAKLDLIDQPLVSWQAYRLKQNETLQQVAAKYGMSAETLKSVNGIGPRARVPVGHTLLVPAQPPSAASAVFGPSRVTAMDSGVEEGVTFSPSALPSSWRPSSCPPFSCPPSSWSPSSWRPSASSPSSSRPSASSPSWPSSSPSSSSPFSSWLFSSSPSSWRPFSEQLCVSWTSSSPSSSARRPE